MRTGLKPSERGGVTPPPPVTSRYMAFFSAYEAAAAIKPRMIDRFETIRWSGKNKIARGRPMPRQLQSFSAIAILTTFSFQNHACSLFHTTLR